METTKTKIFKTNEYTTFKAINVNRKINNSLVAKIKKSMERKNMLEDRPILVNNKMEVLDGQHRLEAAKILNMPVYYMIASSVKYDDIPHLQLSSQWTLDNYLDMEIEKGKQDYKKIKSLMMEYNVRSISLMLSLFRYNKTGTKRNTLLSSTGELKPAHVNEVGAYNSVDFKLGRFVYPSNDTRIKQLLNKITEILELSGKKDKTAAFNSLITIVTDERYVHEQMIENVKNNSIGNAGNTRDYFELYQSIYNKGTHARKKIFFLSTKKAA